MKLLVVLVLAASLASLAVVDAVSIAKLVNKDVHRSIDFMSCIVRIETEITFENAGSAPVSEYIFCVPKPLAKHLALLEAEASNAALETRRVAVDGGHSDCEYYAIGLKKPVSGGASADIVVRGSYTHVMRPFPAEILQSQRQQMVAEVPIYLVSPYETDAVKTVVAFPSAAVVSHDVFKPSTLAGQVLTYGPYKKVAPHSFKLAKLHFENNAPFLAISSMVKEIEVSHWGSNLAIEESVALKHDGAKLKGAFSRFDYQRAPSTSGVSSVRSVLVTLPRDAADVYYRDTIGNVSTSNLRYGDDAAELEMRPRFPLFGGWRTEFYMGYNLPLAKSLGVMPSGKYLLTTNVAASFNEVPMDSVEVRVILPEGASDIAVHLPFDQSPAITIGSRKTYLDTTGRPVVTFVLANLVPEQNVPFQVEYELASASLLHEPMLLIGAFAALFGAAMLYHRIDLTLAPSSA